MGFSSLDVVLIIQSYKAWLARNKQSLRPLYWGIYFILCWIMPFVFMYISPCEVPMNFSPSVYLRVFFFFSELNYQNRYVCRHNMHDFLPLGRGWKEKREEAFWREIIG